MLRLINFKLLTVIFLLLFSGCGSSDMNNKVYRIARDKTFYPLNLLGKENNLLAFTDDLITQISKVEGFKVEFENTARNEMFEDLEEGHYDAIVSFMRPTMRQKLKYDMSDPYFLLGPIIVVQEDSTISSYDDLSDTIVGIAKGMQIAFDDPSDSSIIFTPYENILFALRNLVAGQIDAVIMEAPAATEYISSFYPGELRVIWPPLTQDGLRIITNKSANNQKLIELFNSGLEKLKQDGTYFRLLAKWGLYDTKVIEEIRAHQNL